MIVKKILLIVFLFFFVNTVSHPQVYRITNNLDQDRNPKIIRDLNNRIWCFWESNSMQENKIKAKYFKDEQWSDELIIVDSSNYYYNVDLDRETGKIWMIVTYYSDSVKIYKGQINGFAQVGTYINSLLFDLAGTSFNVIDSSNIWMDLTCGYFNYLIHFNGSEFFEYFSNGLPPVLCSYLKNPKSSVLINSKKIYYTRFGEWACPGGRLGYFDYLFYLDLSDTLFTENIIILKQYSRASTLGMDADRFLYFFNIDYNDSTTQNSLTIVDFVEDKINREVQNLNFFPQSASKYDTICVTGWINEITICYKALNDTLFYKTQCIPENELFNASLLHDLSIEKDDENNAWMAWSGWIDNQFEIFVARKEFSTEIDTNYVVLVYDAEELFKSPMSFELLQNYPNPFNPSTTIKWQQPEAGIVTLKIYDVLGNEVAKLVNEEKPVGEYEIEFNGNELSSGVYFYQIKSGNFVQTKKMILMK